MVEPDYYDNQQSFSETVSDITERDNFLLVQLDNTPFYPGGGGQPCDTGLIKNNEFEGNVVEVYRKEGQIIHKIKPIRGTLVKGNLVEAEVNKQRRENLAKMHSAEHIFLKCLQTSFKNPDDVSLEKIDLGEKESSVFIHCSNLNWALLFKAEQDTNKVIREAKDVKIHTVKKEELSKFPQLRIKEDRIKSETIRIVEIEGFDWSACTGTHVNNTKVVHNFVITKFLSSGKNIYEVRFKVDCDDELLFMAVSVRKTADSLQCDYLSVPKIVDSIRNENEALKKQVYSLSKQAVKDVQKEELGDYVLHWNVFDNINKKQLMQQANDLCSEKKRSIVLFINKTESHSEVILMTSPDLKNAPELLLNTLQNLGGKGGGRDNFASGSVPLESIDNLVEEIRNKLLH